MDDFQYEMGLPMHPEHYTRWPADLALSAPNQYAYEIAMRDARQGFPTLVIGSRGIGKTHFLNSISRRMRADGHSTVLVCRTPDSMESVNAFTHVVRPAAPYLARGITIDFLALDNVELMTQKQVDDVRAALQYQMRVGNYPSIVIATSSVPPPTTIKDLFVGRTHYLQVDWDMEPYNVQIA